ncbi:MAG TPA: helix-turn-helix domain-containing protein [Pseudonocardiaceae bacterium]|nr:helix-turn-helix domain-containing protein [Pseudonocardiaceae bacterium]
MITGDSARGVRFMGEPLWTPDDLSGFLAIPEKTLREWCSKGYGPPWRKVGKHVRYEPGAVREWLGTLTGGTDAA